jgi:hypothetical protein
LRSLTLGSGSSLCSGALGSSIARLRSLRHGTLACGSLPVRSRGLVLCNESGSCSVHLRCGGAKHRQRHI